jgi:hypothetical protein
MTQSDIVHAGPEPFPGEYAVCSRDGRWLVVRYTVGREWLAIADCRTAEIAIAVALDLERAMNPRPIH